MKKYIHDLKVVAHHQLNSEHYVLELELPSPPPEIVAGQFAEVQVDGEPDVMLRRPFSIHDMDPVNNTLSILIKKVGKGSRKLEEKSAGDHINIIYPLGKGFTLPKNREEKVLLVGGGCGVAPLLYLARTLNTMGIRPLILIGGRSQGDLVALKAYEKYGDVAVTTEDGSMGLQGMVTQHPALATPTATQIFTCGPDPMMKAVARIAQQHNIFCEVSLENTMACGIGVCLCCVTDTDEGHQCVCTQGPVFNVNKLKGWAQDPQSPQDSLSCKH